MDAAYGPVASAGIMGAVPGLGGGMTSITKRVAFKVGETVRHMLTIFTNPRLVQVDAALELRRSWRKWMVVYIGSPPINRIVRFLKISTIFLMEVVAMVRG